MAIFLTNEDKKYMEGLLEPTLNYEIGEFNSLLEVAKQYVSSPSPLPSLLTPSPPSPFLLFPFYLFLCLWARGEDFLFFFLFKFALSSFLSVVSTVLGAERY